MKVNQENSVFAVTIKRSRYENVMRFNANLSPFDNLGNLEFDVMFLTIPPYYISHYMVQSDSILSNENFKLADEILNIYASDLHIDIEMFHDTKETRAFWKPIQQAFSEYTKLPQKKFFEYFYNYMREGGDMVEKGELDFSSLYNEFLTICYKPFDVTNFSLWLDTYYKK